MKKIKFITIENLLEMTENNEPFKLVEVLHEEAFKKGHIPGAINIAVDELEEKAPRQLKKDDVIIVYCANYACHASTNAAEKLLGMGYKNVLDYKAGKRGWTLAGLTLES